MRLDYDAYIPSIQPIISERKLFRLMVDFGLTRVWGRIYFSSDERVFLILVPRPNVKGDTVLSEKSTMRFRNHHFTCS